MKNILEYEVPVCKSIFFGASGAILTGSQVSLGGWDNSLNNNVENSVSYGNGLE